MKTLSPDDERFLDRAIAISEHSLTNEGKTPFGALVVVAGEIVGEGASSVVELHDPTAHAEIMALRHAGQALRRHLFDDGTMYCSSEPCPMCLVACYWARIPRLVYGATSRDVGTYGFEDLQFYQELTKPPQERLLVAEVDQDQLHSKATEVLRQWAGRLPFEVHPKL
jgi:guanine deaminase